jgi:hypothetical protein
MGLSAKNRYQAFGVHFLVSLCIIINFSYLIFAHWYPEPFFSADGGWSVFRMVIIVDLVLGPVLTFVIYKPGKKGLKFDLTAIATAQVVALIYGGGILYQERPAYLTFSVDRFVLISEGDIDTSKIKTPELLVKDSKTPRPVFAQLPSDPIEQRKIMDEVLEGKPDLEFRAEYYETFSENLPKVLAKSKDINEFKKLSPQYSAKIDSFLSNHCIDDCAFLPLVGKKRDILLAISKKDGHVVGGIDIDPWQKEHSAKTDINT